MDALATNDLTFGILSPSLCRTECRWLIPRTWKTPSFRRANPGKSSIEQFLKFMSNLENDL
jgi:hypothetical protein